MFMDIEMSALDYIIEYFDEETVDMLIEWMPEDELLDDLSMIDIRDFCNDYDVPMIIGGRQYV